MELRSVAVQAVSIPRHWPARKVALIVGALLLVGIAATALGLAAHAHHTYRATVQTATVGAQVAKVSASPTTAADSIALVTCLCGVVTTLVAVGTFAVSLRKVPAKV